MQYLLTILTGIAFLACNNSIKTNDSISFPSDTIKEISTDSLDVGNESPSRKETKIVIKNKSAYAEKFLQGLKELGYEKFELKDSLLLIDNQDTVYFPETPKIGKQTILTGSKDNLTIELTVKRINYTTLGYKIKMSESGKTSHSQIGKADITPSFFFGEESDESETTGVVYSVSEYTEYKDNDCYTFIRLGYEEETGPYLLGKIKKNCNEKMKDIDLSNFTTLVEVPN